jgi:hypothetical protein
LKANYIPVYILKLVCTPFLQAKPSGSGFSGNIAPSTPASSGFAGRSRGPSSPMQGQGGGGSFDRDSGSAASGGGMYGGGYGSPEQPRSDSPDSSGDGALELSVRAREFVPKFSARESSPSDGAASAAASSSQFGMGMWNGGSGGGNTGDLIGVNGSDEISPPPLIFPSDSLGGDSASNSAGNSMNFEGLRNWGLSDSMDLQMPLEGSRLGSLSGGNRPGGSRHFANSNDDDGDLDMDAAALLGSDILGTLDEADHLAGGRRAQRQSSSFLSSFGNLQNSDTGGFPSSMFEGGNSNSSSGFNNMRDR